jgi:hypothetical protein
VNALACGSMMVSVGPTRGKAGKGGSSKKLFPLIGSPCAAPIMARATDVTPPRGRRYDRRLDPPESVPNLPRSPLQSVFAQSRASPHLHGGVQIPPFGRETMTAVLRTAFPTTGGLPSVVGSRRERMDERL